MSLPYTPKNILITGGAGFIGSHVVEYLVQSYPQYRIVNFDKLDYCSSLQHLSRIQDAPNYKFIKGNICEAEFMSYILKNEQIDTILHFAAQTHVDNSFGNSFQFTENNILGTHRLLEAAKIHNIKRFIHVSTDEVYGGSHDDNAQGFDDSSLLQPTNPYAATKAGAEFLVQAYHRSFNLPTIITRANNIYGPRQYPEKIIPKFILLLANGNQCCIHGDGTHKRNFLFVSDVVRAYDIILHHGTISRIYNIGTDFSISNLDVAKTLIKMFGHSAEDTGKYIQFVENRPFNDYRYSINSEKLTQLGWKPQISWEEGLKITIEWYLQNLYYWPMVENALVPHPREGLQGNDLSFHTTHQNDIVSKNLKN